MECIEAKALKTSFGEELDINSSQQAFPDDFGSGIAVTGDEFSVDDLLDFSNGDFEDDEKEEIEEKGSYSVSSFKQIDDENSNSTTFSANNASESLPAGNLNVPVNPITVIHSQIYKISFLKCSFFTFYFLFLQDDDLENLEWLSRVVDDSVTEYSLLYPTENHKEKNGNRRQNRTELETLKTPCFLSPVPAKARSKRPAKTNVRVWYYRVRKKPEKRKASAEGGRRCSHCLVQKTPQWRTGPAGPKTLCNACGVRFKAGRLFPEYRPACSPTFVGDIHSNSHRKVLEIRRKKEMARPESGLPLII